MVTNFTDPVEKLAGVAPLFYDAGRREPAKTFTGIRRRAIRGRT